MSPHIHDAGRGPRALLRQLREVMAERKGGQNRLDRFVGLIARNMRVEVCSIYLRRANGDLELFATEGLAKEAVHRTRLKPGEGLVGVVANASEPINLADARRHPKFSYRPETAEDAYRSFLGVPILRGGRLLGVLAVQGSEGRRFFEDEIEAVQTVAMVLAEIVASGELVEGSELDEADIHPVGPERLQGVGLAEGIGFGHVVLHMPEVEVRAFIAEDPDAEAVRLEQALVDLRKSIDDMVEQAGASLSGVPLDVLEAYRLFAYDRGWASRLREAIGSGLTAEAAVERVRREDRARLTAHNQPYFRERGHDLDDLADRLLRILAGETDAAPVDLPDDAIVVARAIGPADLLSLDRAHLRGLALEEGSAMSHVSIVAKAIGVPLVGRLKGLLRTVEPGDHAVIDGETGDFHVRPPNDIVESFTSRAAMRSERLQAFSANAGEPALTRDGVRVRVQANMGLDVDLPQLETCGAEGIGLFRTELQFLVSRRLPRLRDQQKLYEAAFDAAGEEGVVFRTVDLGGDKVLPYLHFDREQNPAMGWRALRVTLDRPGLFRYQLRALIRAARGRRLDLLLPMVTDVGEVRAVKTLIAQEMERLSGRAGWRGADIRVGAMIEVPSAAWAVPAILEEVSFIAVGTNDLHQFFFAVDRGSDRLAKRFDMLSPAFLSFLKRIAQAAEAAGKEASVCGMHAARPVEALGIIGAGFRKLSTPPAAVGMIKDAVRRVSCAELERTVAGLIEDPRAADGRARFERLAAEAGIRSDN